MTGSRFARWSVPVPAVFVLLSLPAGLPGQEDRIDCEIRFVRSLARDLRFVGLARAEAERLREEHTSAASLDKLAQLAIEVSLWGAKADANRASRQTLYKDALARSEELIARTGDASVARDARMTLADACQEFGTFLIEELEIARAEEPDRLDEIESEAAGVFRAGVEACERVMADLEAEIRGRATSEADRQDKELHYHLTWLRKGILLREHGRAVRADRGYLCARAKTTLEELSFEVGEGRPLGLRGVFEYARCEQVLGNTEEAVTLYEAAIEEIATSLGSRDGSGARDLPAQTQELLFEMMQEIYDELALLLLETGDVDALEALFGEFREHLTEFGSEGLQPFEIADARFGHSVFLTEAQAAAESGNPERVREALALARKINDHPSHANDLLGIRAKRVIEDILDAHGELVSGELLFEIAKGECARKNYEEAIKGVKRALAAMTPEETTRLGLQAHELMGTCYVLTDRVLEGVLALERGLQRHGRDNGEAAGEVAVKLDKAARRLGRVTREDPFFEGLLGEVGDVVDRYGSDGVGDNWHWRRANQAWTSGDYAGAAREFAEVTREYVYYELARSRRAMALARAGDHPASKQAMADYREWLDTEEAVIESRRTDLKRVRDQAIAELDFNEITMLYDEATGAHGARTEKDLTTYPAVLEKGKAFVANHRRDGANFLPRVYDIMGRLHAELGQMDQAEEAYRTLKDVDSRGVLLPMLATVIFDSYLTRVDSLDKERRAAVAQDKDRAAMDIGKQLRRARERLVEVGTEYARTAPRPQYGVLSHTLHHLDLLEDWTRLEEIARKAIDLYGNDAEYAARVDRVVRPKVGEALLRQRRFQEAHDMLIRAEKAYPNLYEVKRLIALALGGWFEFDERTAAPVVLPGLDRADEAYRKYYVEYGPWGLRPEVREFSLEWYAFHWEAYWFAHRAIARDDAFAERARALYRIARSIDDFATLRNLGPEGRELWDKFRANRPR